MSFTLKSEKLIKHFIHDFDKYCNKKSTRVRKSTDNILKLIFRDIKLSENWVNTVKKKGLLATDIKKITDSLKNLPQSNLMDSSFVPGNIKDKILYNIRGYMSGSIKIGSTNVTVYYGLFKEVENVNHQKIKKEILEAMKIIKFCMLNKGSNQVNNLDIYLYLTDEEKKLPKNDVFILGPKNCNSAVTYACTTNGKILIYRKEEWKKVLIHELFHSLCLDFAISKYDNLKKNVKKIFDVNSDFELSESYSEYWATILNASFLSYKLLDDKNNIDDFLLFFDFCIQLERIFSLFQMIKMLHYMGLNYSMIYKKTKKNQSFRNVLYKEDTNILCYYVIKTIFLFFNDDFLVLCLRNNSTIIKFDKTQQNFSDLYNFIEKKYKKKTFLDSIINMKKFYDKMERSYKKNHKEYIDLLTTCRMTICEN